MLEARLVQGGTFKKLIEAIKEIITETNFDCSATGIALQGMDASHIALCVVYLKRDGFDKYRCDEAATLGINVASLAKMFKCANNDDSVTMTFDEEQEDFVTFDFANPKTDRSSNFQLKLMEIQQEHLSVPDSEYESVLSIPTGEFQKICRDLGLLGDAVKISVDEESVSFNVEGDVGSGTVTLKKSTAVDDEKDLVSITCETETSLKFSLKYLQMFAKAAPLSDTVNLSMSDGFPMLIEFAMGEMGYLRYYLAPKVEDDDEEESDDEEEDVKQEVKDEPMSDEE
eukprot:TRINITY_DN8043_c0_g1_i1.p1 TRINITY_DN8043_c0_g1~~TRINITY_DN8043_c0_g1_i1.p1  ORF type:complete len:285 (-),score=113.37 TRINITY_DN8043_c0_g1_i1:241-1095(-)